MIDKKDMKAIDLAAHAACIYSKDPSTKVGAIIVSEDRRREYIGVNGFPSGCDDSPSLFEDRPTKYSRVVHAELNAIIKAGHDARDGTIYVTPLFTCGECAKAVIQAGIKRVVSPYPVEERWLSSYETAMNLYVEAGVQFEFI